MGSKNDHVLSIVRGRVYRIPVIGGKESYFSDPLMYQIVGAYRIRPPDATDGGEYMSCVRPPDVPAKGTNADTRLYRRLFHDNHPGPIMPDWRAYAIRPYPNGRKKHVHFLNPYVFSVTYSDEKWGLCGYDG